jgi:uncharacterized membrane protein
MNLIVVGATWLHVIATVTLVGYYVVLGLLILPTLRRLAPPTTTVETIASMQGRATPVFVVALIVFLATGVYLLGLDPQYRGPGNIAGSWGTFLAAKHVLVAVMVGLGLYHDGIIVRLAARAAEAADADLNRVARTTWGMALMGAAVLLLTAAAQAA